MFQARLRDAITWALPFTAALETPGVFSVIPTGSKRLGYEIGSQGNTAWV